MFFAALHVGPIWQVGSSLLSGRMSTASAWKPAATSRSASIGGDLPGSTHCAVTGSLPAWHTSNSAGESELPCTSKTIGLLVSSFAGRYSFAAQGNPGMLAGVYERPAVVHPGCDERSRYWMTSASFGFFVGSAPETPPAFPPCEVPSPLVPDRQPEAPAITPSTDNRTNA